MSTAPTPPSEQPGARAGVGTADDGSEPATFLTGWAQLMRSLGRDLPAGLARTRDATRRIASTR